MEITEIIPQKNILMMEAAREDKQELLREVLESTVKDTDLEKCKEDLWRTLLERERSMSTGIGLGVAIPHCSSEFVHDVKGFLVLLKKGIDFQAVDDEPVRIIVLLLLPKNKFEKHIKTLASIARLFNDETFRKKILKARTSEEVFELIQNETKAKNGKT